MATPAAAGMVLTADRKRTVQIQSNLDDGGSDHKTGPLAKAAQKTAPAKANHLSCWRSSPCDRRKRSTRETAPIAAAASARKRPAIPSASSSAPTPSMPNGLLASRSEVSSGPGLKAKAKI